MSVEVTSVEAVLDQVDVQVFHHEEGAPLEIVLKVRVPFESRQDAQRTLMAAQLRKRIVLAAGSPFPLVTDRPDTEEKSEAGTW